MRKIARIMAEIVLSGLLIFGCGRSQPPKAPDEVKLQLKWLHQAQFAGFYMAQEKGYYAKENIKVTFLEGGQDVDIAGSVISGKADFGVVSPEEILIRPQPRGAAYRHCRHLQAALSECGKRE